MELARGSGGRHLGGRGDRGRGHHGPGQVAKAPRGFYATFGLITACAALVIAANFLLHHGAPTPPALAAPPPAASAQPHTGMAPAHRAPASAPTVPGEASTPADASPAQHPRPTASAPPPRPRPSPTTPAPTPPGPQPSPSALAAGATSAVPGRAHPLAALRATLAIPGAPPFPATAASLTLLGTKLVLTVR